MFEENFGKTLPVGRLGIIAPESCRELGKKIDEQLIKWRTARSAALENHPVTSDYVRDTYLIKNRLSRLGTGEGRGELMESVRGDDIYILTDVCNSSLSYSISGKPSTMSPDGHYQDLKRLVASVGGKARQITVIMPFLYEGRLSNRSGRESLDCAIMLQELYSMRVSNIITFDAHDARVQNAIPLGGFETIQPVYQFVKGLLTHVPDLFIDNNHMMVVCPDEGAAPRAIYMANNLGVDMGMFYRRRDYSRVVNGRNPVVAHEFLGSSVDGKDLLIIDDMISSGDSMLEVARELKKRGARKIFMFATFGLLTGGLKKFDMAYERGLFDKILTTNLTYQPSELLAREYYIDCDMSKYLAFIIEHLNHGASISGLLNPVDRIQNILAKYRNGEL